jgi:catechol 2,3-dioxygenase-like lactoylglutathione lyase family enzyme
MAGHPFVKRPALVVHDLDRALGLYRDALGFAVRFVKASAPDSYSYAVFDLPRDIPLRFATLDDAAGGAAVLGLIEAPGALPADSARPRASAVVIHLERLDEALEKVRALPGVEVMAETRLVTQDGRVGREVAVIDADGHAVLLYRIETAG